MKAEEIRSSLSWLAFISSKLGVDIALPQADDVANRSTLEEKRDLSVTARQNLMDWWCEDYEFVRLCREVAETVNESESGSHSLTCDQRLPDIHEIGGWRPWGPPGSQIPSPPPGLGVSVRTPGPSDSLARSSATGSSRDRSNVRSRSSRSSSARNAAGARPKVPISREELLF